MGFPRVALPAVLLVILSPVSCSGLKINDSGFPSGAYAIIQGATTTDSTQLGVLLPKKEKFELTLTDLKTGFEQVPDALQVHERGFSDWKMVNVSFQGLSPATAYGFSVYRKEADGRTLQDYRRLRVPDLEAGEATILVASCMDDAFPAEQETMWKQVLEQGPRLAFFIGDNVYADRTVNFYKGPALPEMLWNRHVETRNLVTLFRARELMPVYSVWDDHDYGMNDGNREYAHREASQKVFDAFFPRDPGNGFERGPGLARVLQAVGQTFVFLDDRSFRSPNGVEGAGQTHWGEAQEKWLFGILDKAVAPVWLINGDQYFGGYHKFESYEGSHPESFRKFLAKLRDVKVPVIFVSGDRHLTELMRIGEPVLGYETYEITSSAIHAKTFPDSWVKEPNPRQIEGRDGVMNYVILDVLKPRAEGGKSGVKFKVTAYGPDEATLYERELEVAR